MSSISNIKVFITNFFNNFPTMSSNYFSISSFIENADNITDEVNTILYSMRSISTPQAYQINCITNSYNETLIASFKRLHKETSWVIILTVNLV